MTIHIYCCADVSYHCYQGVTYVNKAHIKKNMNGLLNKLKFVYKMSVDVLKFVVAVQNWFVRRAGCSIIDFYSSSEM